MIAKRRKVYFQNENYTVDVGGGYVYYGESDTLVADKALADKVYKVVQQRILASNRRKWKENAMRDCGLVKVRGALGGTYWE